MTSAAGVTATWHSRTALDVFVGDLPGCGLFHDGVLAHDMSLNVRPYDECRRRLSGRRNGELLDMGQRTGRCRFYLLNAVCSRFELVPRDEVSFFQT